MRWKRRRLRPGPAPRRIAGRAIRDLADGFEAAVGGIVGTLASATDAMQDTARTMTATARETASQSTTVAAAAERAASNVDTVAAAAEELGSSVQEDRASGRRLSGMRGPRGCRRPMETGQFVRCPPPERVRDRIGDVVALISGIAAQTNLLALNATIEAARGRRGRAAASPSSPPRSRRSRARRRGPPTRYRAKSRRSSMSRRAPCKRSARSAARSGRSMPCRRLSQQPCRSRVRRRRRSCETSPRPRPRRREVTSSIVRVAGAATETGAATAQVLAAASEMSLQVGSDSAHRSHASSRPCGPPEASFGTASVRGARSLAGWRVGVSRSARSDPIPAVPLHQHPRAHGGPARTGRRHPR